MSFIFGGSTNITPEQAQRQRLLADTFARQMAREGVARNVPEGIVSLANSIASTIAGRRADKSEGKLRNQAANDFANVMASMGQGGNPLAAAGGGGSYAPSANQGPSPSEALVNAVIKQESNGEPLAVSPAGAQGLMQVMPDTAANPGFGLQPLKNPFDEVENKQFGTAYLGKMLERYNGDVPRALAAYNWGPGNADKWDGNMESLPAETRTYINNITGSLQGQSAPQPQQQLSQANVQSIQRFGRLLNNPYLGEGERAIVQNMLNNEMAKMQPPDPMRQLQMENLRSQIDARGRPWWVRDDGTVDPAYLESKRAGATNVNVGGGNFKVPSGYMSNPDGSPTVVPIPGGPNDPNTPTTKLRNDSNRINNAAAALDQGLDDYLKLIEKHGVEVAPGKGQDSLLTARRDLQLQAKELFNLGVLNGPDLQLMDELLIDPTSIKNAAVQFLGGGSVVDRARSNVAQLKRQFERLRRASTIEGAKRPNLGGSSEELTDEELLERYGG